LPPAPSPSKPERAKKKRAPAQKKIEVITPGPPSKSRIKCTYYLDTELERDLNRVQAQYRLADQNIEKSTIVSEALRRYLPQVAQQLPQHTASSPKSAGRVKRTYYLDADVERGLNRVQAQYQLEGQRVEKSELINAALRQYLPQVKEYLERPASAREVKTR
jgi:thymidylate kinase